MEYEMKQRGLFRAANSAPPCLVPIDKRAQEIMAELGADKKALVSVHTPRYPEHHGFVFMVLGKIAKATDHDVRSVLLSLLYETGRFDYVRLLDNTVVPDPQSLSPESMTQPEFQKFWDEARGIIRTKWQRFMSPQDFAEIDKLIGERQ
jgi:hypothetical protein